MNFKLIVALVADEMTDKVVNEARRLGATGATIITSAHGAGLNPKKSFMGLTVEGQVDVILFIVEQHKCREILEGIAVMANFEGSSGTGIALQIDIEDAIGLGGQLQTIEKEIEDQI